MQKTMEQRISPGSSSAPSPLRPPPPPPHLKGIFYLGGGPSAQGKGGVKCMARGGGPEGGDGAGAPGVRYPLPGVWGGGVGMAPPPSVGPGGGSPGLYPRWRLLRHALEHLVYPVILDHHCGDRRGGGGGTWVGVGTRAGVASYLPPPLPAAPPLPRSEGSGMRPPPYGMWGGGVPTSPPPPPAARCGWLDGEMGVGRTPPSALRHR